jgi:sporulation protein YlmC with PRC-barrel domain
MSNPIEQDTSLSATLEGTAVVGRDGDQIGSIESAIIDRASGAVSHVVLSARRFGFIAARYLLPWDWLYYDRRLAAYRVNVTQGQLQAASISDNPFGMGL